MSLEWLDPQAAPQCDLGGRQPTEDPGLRAAPRPIQRGRKCATGREQFESARDLEDGAVIRRAIGSAAVSCSSDRAARGTYRPAPRVITTVGAHARYAEIRHDGRTQEDAVSSLKQELAQTRQEMQVIRRMLEQRMVQPEPSRAGGSWWRFWR